jgi:outer membrane protein assembly factor BamE (lipoprotein component of BamABCDE complex)
LKNPLSILTISLAAMLLVACSSSEHIDGQLPSPDKLADIELGVTTRDDVLDLIGTPSTTPPFDDDNWYYIRRVTQTVAFFDPVVMEQQVLAINFDREGVAVDIYAYGEDYGRSIDISERITPTQGKKVTIWEQLLSSYGRMPEGSGSGAMSAPGMPGK